MSPAPVPPASPFTLTLELTRSENASAPFAFQPGGAQYLRRMEDGSYRDAVLDWDPALLEDLAALEAIPADRGVVQRLGDRLRTFLEEVGWESQEAQLLQALGEQRPIHLTLRFAAAELYALPWELLTLRARGQHLGELPSCTVRYEWLGASCRPSEGGARPAGGRILFAWSGAGGDVPARLHLQALRRACERAGWPFDEARDVLPHVSLAGLAQALAAPGEPVAVLHLLCHGSARGETYGLLWNESPEGGGEQFVDGGALRQVLEAYAGSLRLVVLCACQSGGAGGLGNSLGSVALALHRIGLEAVVASRLPLSVAGSVLLTRALYERMLAHPDSLEDSLAEARARLARGTEGLDWASLQLYAYAEQGFDTRPLVFRPYRGLLPLETDSGRFFFGHPEVARRLHERVVEAGKGACPRFQLLVGAAGSGKSLVVRAGLLPSLSSESWEVAWVRPGGSVSGAGPEGGTQEGWPSVALASLARALRLSPPTGSPPSQAEPEDVLVEAMRQRQQPWSSLLLVVEPLEEVFTRLSEPEQRRSFVRALWKLSLLAEASVVVLAVLREESLERCGELTLEEPGPRLEDVARSEEHQLLLPPLQAEQLLRIIEGPARRVGLVLEDGLAEVLLREVEHEPDPLSLLAYALDLLWEKREGCRLTLRAYADLGGVGGALAWQADRLYQKLGRAEKDAARRLLVSLVEVREETQPYLRRRARRGELRPPEAGERQSSFDQALECFLSARLLTWQQDAEATRGELWVQVAHEALIRRWERLRQWVHDASELQGQLHALQDKARQWAQHRERRDGGASHLLTGEQLDEARRFQSRHGEELTPEVHGLITASWKRHRWRQRLTRWGLVGLMAVALLVTGRMTALATEASRERQKAERQWTLAREAEQMAIHAQDRARLEAAIALLDEAPARSLLLLRGVRTREMLESPRWAMAARAILQQPVSWARLRLGHEQFTAVAFDETGKEVVVGTARGSVLRWSPGSREAPRPVDSELGTEILQVGFGPGGTRVFALGGTRLWHWSLNSDPKEPSRESASFAVRAVSAEGQYAVKQRAGRLRPVSLANSKELPGELPGDDYRQVELSVDPGRRVLRGMAATNGKSVWFRSERQGARWLCATTAGCGGPVRLVALHPEGGLVAAVVDEELVRVWNEDGTHAWSSRHSSPIQAVAFSPKEEQLAVGLEDGTVHLWHTRSGRRLAILRGHDLAVESVAFNGLGELASASRDGTVLLWRVKLALLPRLPLLLEEHPTSEEAPSPIEEVAIAPKEDKVITASADGTVRVWPVDVSQPFRELKLEEGTRVWRVGFSGNGEAAVLSSGPGQALTVHLWREDGQELTWSPPSHPEEADEPEWLETLAVRGVNTVPLRARLETPEAAQGETRKREVRSMAGMLLAEDENKGKEVALWSEELRTLLQGHTSAVRALAWSRDGRVATTSGDGTVRIWADHGREQWNLQPPGEKSPFAVAWAPTGRHLAVSGRHGLVFSWRLVDSSPVAHPEWFPSGHTNEISAMAFSRDGKQLLTGSVDGTARLWPLLTVEEVRPLLSELSSFCLEPDELAIDLSLEERALVRNACP
ncbi:CHAT domain-containing protein [Archangium violaceum]|uniref:Uncharacterized protein n=1 Tax=Archangium violaceum Cb vi76 TaxID=1406225 RepID=A0A084SHM9_9BACT|nr:CHAT domain-containing protein [Archangium violaceum]KFA87964.1 hypothetical protein Q664_44385 [Archangium violaceum Cb vi76]